MSIGRLLLIAIVLIAGGGALLLGSRDPERLPMDAAARAAAPGAFVTLGDGVTHYTVDGPDSGQRVMLVHGFSVPSYIWDSTVTALTAAGFRVARYDHFGRGYSDRPDGRYNAERYDRQLTQLLDSLAWREPVDLIGLSMGGPVVANFAALHPERTRSLTLIDPAAGPRDVLPWYLRLPVVGGLLWQALAVPGMAAGQLTDFVEPTQWPDWVERYRVQTQYRGFGRALRSTLMESQPVMNDSVYALAGATKVPTLLLWGTEDQTVTIDRAEVVRRAIPQAQFHAIERAGHLPHMERGDLVNPLLVGFLRPPQDQAVPPTPAPR